MSRIFQYALIGAGALLVLSAAAILYVWIWGTRSDELEYTGYANLLIGYCLAAAGFIWRAA